MPGDHKLFDQIQQAGRAFMEGKRDDQHTQAESGDPVGEQEEKPTGQVPSTNTARKPDDMFFILVQEAGKRIMDLKMEKLAELGLPELSVNMFQYVNVIGSLESPNATQIAAALDLTKPSVTAILQKLERVGLVARERDSADRRAVRIVLTGKGRQVMDAYLDAHRAFADDIRSRLEPDAYGQLVELLARGMGQS